MSRVGVGLDYKFIDSYFEKKEYLFESFGKNFSHFSIVGLQNRLDAEEFLNLVNGKPILHHLNGVSPAGVGGISLAQLAREKEISEIISPQWCLEDIGIWNIGPYALPYFTPPVFHESVLNQTIDGINSLQEIMGIQFAAEVPSCSFVAGCMDLCTFFRRLVNETGCKIVLDVSHIYSYCIYMNKDIAYFINNFPFSSVIEFHIAGGSVHPNYQWRYRDTHSEPVVKEVLKYLEQALICSDNLRAITYEVGVGLSKEIFDRDFETIEMIAEKHNFNAVF